MAALSAAELLELWEAGQVQSPTRRALLLLAAACPDTPAERLAQLSIGQRDARLLRLRERIFGPKVACLLACPHCRERLELTFDAADIQMPEENADSRKDGDEQEPDRAGGACRVLSLAAGDFQVEFRLPNSLDLLAVTEGAAGEPEGGSTRQRLLQRCLLAVRRDEQAQPIDQLPAAVVDALMARMAQADPLADVRLDVECPSCRQHWPAAFDITSFLWRELDAWARRILVEVHLLAQAYGWRESEILALSTRRRQCYLEMVRG